MQDEPTPHEIVVAVAAFLRTVTATPSAHAVYQARVAANALDLVARQLALAPASDAAEHDRLRALFGHDGTLADLNTALARGIADGRIDPAAPAVAAHLLATTLAKLAIDQPAYSGYRAALDKDC